MATLKIEERFTLEADPDVVFGYLEDPSRVVVCLPGASLDGQNEDGSYAGTIKVKLGTASIAYKGTMRFLEVDAAQRLVRLEGKGRERAGQGSVTMSMESRVVAVDGGSEVTVDADVQLAGKIVRFARGMIQNVSQELFRQFTVCLAETIATAEGEAADGEPPPQAAAAELSALGLLWSTFRSWLRRVFGGGAG